MQPRWAHPDILKADVSTLQPAMTNVHPDDVHTLAVVSAFLRHLHTPVGHPNKTADSAALYGPIIDNLSHYFNLRYELPKKGTQSTIYAHLDDIRRVLNLNELLRNEPVICVMMEAKLGIVSICAQIRKSQFCYQLPFAEDAEEVPSVLNPRRSPRTQLGPVRGAPNRAVHKSPFDRMPTEDLSRDRTEDLLGMPSLFALTVLKDGLLRGLDQMQLYISQQYTGLVKDDLSALALAATVAINCVAGHTGWTCNTCAKTECKDTDYIAHVVETHKLSMTIDPQSLTFEVRIGAPEVCVTWEYAATMLAICKDAGGLVWMRVGVDADADASREADDGGDDIFSDTIYGVTAPAPTQRVQALITHSDSRVPMVVVDLPAAAATRTGPRSAFLSLGVPKAQYGAVAMTDCTTSASIDPHHGTSCLQCPVCIREACTSRQPRYTIARTTKAAHAIPSARRRSEHPLRAGFHSNPLFGNAHLR